MLGMSALIATERRRLEALERADLERHQLARLNALVAEILPANRFYADKLADVARPLTSLAELAHWPYTFKAELQHARGANHLAVNRTFEAARYVRYHETSGTRGRPLAVLDTAEDWRWWTSCWQFTLDAADVQPEDRALLAFSFGPFIGFWSAADALLDRGCLLIPAGGLRTLGRLELLRTSAATILCCTPSYALHLTEVATDHQIDTRQLGVRKIIVSGEPGGSVPALRARIEDAWNARVYDHAGASEVGPWGYCDANRQGLHVLECEFIAEFLGVETGQPATDGELSELVLTTLGRVGAPVIRYRTGDLVRPRRNPQGPNRFVFLEGGVLGRADDMVVVRGVNVFPSAIDQILRGFPEVLEYRIVAHKVAEMDQLSIEVEDRLERPERVSEELRTRLGLRIDVRCVPLGTLPRFEGKGQRFVDER